MADPSLSAGGRAVRRPIEDAKALLTKGDHGDVCDERAGKALLLNFDFNYPPNPERKPEIDWMVRQFAKQGLQLEVRASGNSPFQDKTCKGQYKVFSMGWNADDPDAENFLLLLTCKASKTLHDGENMTNDNNPDFDRLCQQMKVLDERPAKRDLIDQMVAIMQTGMPRTRS